MNFASQPTEQPILDWIADAHHRYGKRFIVRADELLTAFLELERAIHEFAVSLISYWPRRNVCADEKLTAFVELESAIRPCAELACQVGEIFGK